MQTTNLQKLSAFVARQHQPIAVVCDLGLSGLAATLSLGRMGVPVLGICHTLEIEGAFSKYCFKAVSPDPDQQPEEYIIFLIEIGQQLKTKAVLIPTSDVVVDLLCRMRERLAPYYLFPISGYQIVKILSDKGEFKRELERLGLPHPRTFVPNCEMGIETIAGEVKYPCIIKPVHSQRFTAQFHVKVFVATDRKELIEACETAAQNGHLYIIQEFIPGPDENMHLVQGYFNNKSEPIGIFTFKRVRQYPRHFGNGALCESKWVPSLAEQVSTFIRAIGHQGIIDAELKLDPRDNQFKFIEINPRPGWQTRLATRCGINSPYLAYLDALGKPLPKTAQQVEGIKWLATHGDMKSAFEAWREGQLTMRQYLHSFSGKIEFAIFAWDDPLPFLYAIKQAAQAGVRKVFRKMFRRF